MKNEENHPSFGMLSIVKVWGSTTLNGSNIKHQHFYSLSISTASKQQDEYSIHWYNRDQIVEILLSPNQLIDMFTQINSSGIPCTLNWVQGEGYIEKAPDVHSRKKLQDDIKSAINRLGERISDMSNRVDELMNKKAALTKAEKKEITDITLKIRQDYESNLPYLHKCQEEHMEKIITEVSSEVENNIAQVIRGAGIKGIEKLISNIDIPLIEE